MRAWAGGLLCLAAAVELLISHEHWLWREDFDDVALGWTRHVFTGQRWVTVDYAAAVQALLAGVLPCSAGERQILLVAASIAEGNPGGFAPGNRESGHRRRCPGGAGHCWCRRAQWGR